MCTRNVHVMCSAAYLSPHEYEISSTEQTSDRFELGVRWISSHQNAVQTTETYSNVQYAFRNLRRETQLVRDPPTYASHWNPTALTYKRARTSGER